MVGTKKIKFRRS